MSPYFVFAKVGSPPTKGSIVMIKKPLTFIQYIAQLYNTLKQFNSEAPIK